MAASGGRERVPDGEANPPRRRAAAGGEDEAGALVVGGAVEEDAAAARVERDPAPLGVEGRAGRGGADEAGGDGFIGGEHVAEEAQHRGTPALEVKVAKAGAEGEVRDEAGPALADERGADEVRRVVRRGAEEDLFHELVRQRRRSAQRWRRRLLHLHRGSGAACGVSQVWLWTFGQLKPSHCWLGL